MAALLQSLPESTYQAWDTEVMEINAAEESPVGHGTVICASVFCGPAYDFGNGPRIWIDNLDEARGTLDAFKPVLESPSVRKVWHNYGFDRHVLFNEGIDCQGLAGDTMHMARLWDTARLKKGGYSLEALTAELLKRRKVPMKEIFAVPRLLKSGKPSKTLVLAPVEDIQRNPATLGRWIDYSTYDAECTWLLRERLEVLLRGRPWTSDKSMWDFYQRYWVPFATLLTDMEREGIRVDTAEKLPLAQHIAENERAEAERAFLAWAAELCPDAGRMNVGSDVQKAHFLFAPCVKEAPGLKAVFGAKKAAAAQSAPAAVEVPVDVSSEDEEDNEGLLDEDGEAGDAAPARASASKFKSMPKDASSWPRERVFQVEEVTERPLAEDEEDEDGTGLARDVKKSEITLRGLGIPAVVRTASGWPAVSTAVLKKLAGQPRASPPKFGSAYEHFGGGAAGQRACEALESLYTVSVVDTMLSNFIIPLQSMADANERVHCSLNLNTETGRLSARRPNLQNQPALEKDRYRIREAFVSRPGHTFIVADYGQLELRVLAHMAKCRSMIDAFAAGGDFHSRTAMSMYPEVKEKVASGEVLLEWDEARGAAPKPLLKSVFASERRKAKILNFSLAYGKTAIGLAKDWNTSLEEAKETLERWYADRPEVREWQERMLRLAREQRATRTLMGRYRDLPDIVSPNRRIRGHAERAAINTPIQGGAADVVMMAMLKIARNERLRALGWKMVLQIHDEVILEGPEESSAEALALVEADMARPFEKPLLVDLDVDAKTANNWYAAK